LKNGYGVELKDGSTVKLDVVVKCTGFHRNAEVPNIVDQAKCYPWGTRFQYAVFRRASA